MDREFTVVLLIGMLIWSIISMILLGIKIYNEEEENKDERCK